MRWFRMQRQRIRNTVNSNFVEIKIQFIEPVYICPRTKRRSKQLSLSVLTQLVITVITQYTPVTTI